MTKKDFKLIAAALASIPCHEATRSAFAEALANTLATTNPRFDREKFLRACRGER